MPCELNQFAAQLGKHSTRLYNKTLSLVRKVHTKKGFGYLRTRFKNTSRVGLSTFHSEPSDICQRFGKECDPYQVR